MCDCIFNTQIPTSEPTRVIIRPSAGTFVTGIAKQYSEVYPFALDGYVTEREYNTIMQSINDMLFTYFPCPLCWCFGYICCIPTLGLSLCCPAICVNDAESNLRNMINRINRQKLEYKNIKLVLRKQCSTSWLEFELPAKSDSVRASETTQNKSS